MPRAPEAALRASGPARRAAARRAVAIALGSLLGVFAVLAGASAASAYESISSYDVQAQVTPDGLMHVTETIAYDFGTEQRHGIFRTLPVEDGLPDGSRWVHPVTVESVTMDGGTVPYDLSQSGMLLEVKIGEPDRTITGQHAYVLSYTVQGALRTMTADELAASNPYGFSPGDVELYWDFIGTGWDVGMDAVRVQVTGPGNVLAAQCYRGTYGSRDPCHDRILGASVTFVPAALSPGEGLTGVIAYPGSAFTTPPVRTITAPTIAESPDRVLPIGLVVALILLVLPIALVLVLRGRLRGADIPNAPVQFGPPGNLRPAEIQVSLDGDLDSRGVLATLLDLAARRYVTIGSDPGGLFAKGRINLAWWGAGTDTLRPWEQSMLSAVFEGRDRATLEGYDPDFARAVENAEKDLKDQAIAARRLSVDAKSARTGIGCAATAFLALGVIVLFAGIAMGNAVIGAGVAPALLGLGVGLVIASLLTPQKETVDSARFEALVEGFRRFLDTDPGAARRELARRLGLPDYAIFATMLPYAVLFDLAQSWSGAFPDLTEEQLHSTGLYVANTVVLTQLLSAGTQTVAAAYTAPSASGGSGFSGGGFSGGGGGGGGGGSW